jgi:CRP-like cAMP-binding protein
MSSAIKNNTLFVTKLKQYGYIPDEIAEDLDSKVQTISKRKGSYVIKEGQIITSFFVVEKGLIRSFYKNENQEITIWFGYEGLPFAASSSAFNNKPSRETIECLEDCIFQYISGKEMEELYQKYNEVNTIGRKLIEEYCDMANERNYAFQMQSAEERYKDLIKYEPEIIKRAPLRYIASYLGISQETLSRVRKK